MPEANFPNFHLDLDTPWPETPYIPLLSNSNTITLGYPGTIPNNAAPAGTYDTIEHPPTSVPPATATSADEDHRRAYHRMTPQTSRPASKAKKQRRLNEAERFNSLLTDEYVLLFTPTEVTCAGCASTIQLEQRNGARYYVGRWTRHKGTCRGVQEGMVSR